jgi:hypothetical protein
MVHANATPKVTIDEVTDPREIERHRVQDEWHARNLKWLESHWSDLPHACGRYVAVADEQAFVAETAAAAWAWVRSEHPHDGGAVVMRVPAEQGWRIYANCRQLVFVSRRRNAANRISAIFGCRMLNRTGTRRWRRGSRTGNRRFIPTQKGDAFWPQRRTLSAGNRSIV